MSGHIDTLKCAVPALAYTVQNNLLFVAISRLSAPVYQAHAPVLSPCASPGASPVPIFLPHLSAHPRA